MPTNSHNSTIVMPGFNASDRSLDRNSAYLDMRSRPATADREYSSPGTTTFRCLFESR